MTYSYINFQFNIKQYKQDIKTQNNIDKKSFYIIYKMKKNNVLNTIHQ